MARARRRTTPVEAADIRHKGEQRTNIPPAKIAGEGQVPRVPPARYWYSPHLSPTLRFDPEGSCQNNLTSNANEIRLSVHENRRTDLESSIV